VSTALVFEDLDWIYDARMALAKVARMGKPFDAYTLTEVAELRDPPNKNMWGTLFRQAAKDGVIRRVGFHESRRPGRRSGVCRIWEAAA
jgi:hypothetical protein